MKFLPRQHRALSHCCPGHTVQDAGRRRSFGTRLLEAQRQSVDHADILVCQQGCRTCQRTGRQQVIGRQEGHVVAAGRLETIVVRLDVPPVSVVRDEADSRVVSETRGNLRSVVRGGIVHDEHLHANAILAQGATHRVGEEMPVVVTGDDHTDEDIVDEWTWPAHLHGTTPPITPAGRPFPLRHASPVRANACWRHPMASISASTTLSCCSAVMWGRAAGTGSRPRPPQPPGRRRRGARGCQRTVRCTGTG